MYYRNNSALLIQCRYHEKNTLSGVQLDCAAKCGTGFGFAERLTNCAPNLFSRIIVL